MAILVAGGAGYIGSHTCVELLQAGYAVVVVDNLSNSNEKVLQRVEQITKKKVKFYQIDVQNQPALREVFRQEQIEAVINFAGLKAVGESVEQPLLYYQNNIMGLLSLCRTMQEFGVKRFVFSSSATVYGEPETMPITEEVPIGHITNPYGQTKVMSEQILRDLYTADASWSVLLLRYFNPIGAHESGLIGEDPKGIPNNLMPYIAQVAVGRLPYLNVFGNDYPTPDGTGIRDYIHVTDLAKGHVKALEHFEAGVRVYNLGTGRGYSVLDVLHAYESACGRSLPYRIQPRRAGDIAICYCNAEKASRELGWMAEKTLEDMCRDSWHWQKNHPDGYDTKPKA